MSKSKILETLKRMDWISQHWRVKDFLVLEDDEKIIFSYYHGDMGLIDKIEYNKKDGDTIVYDLDNYTGNTYIYTRLYLPL